MIRLKTLIAIGLLTTLISGCKSTTKYRPVIYGHDYVTREIIEPVSYKRISTGDCAFNNYVSISLKDLAKLNILLKDAKVSKKVRILIEKFDNEVRKHKNSQKTEILCEETK